MCQHGSEIGSDYYGTETYKCVHLCSSNSNPLPQPLSLSLVRYPLLVALMASPWPPLFSFLSFPRSPFELGHARLSLLHDDRGVQDLRRWSNALLRLPSTPPQPPRDHPPYPPSSSPDDPAEPRSDRLQGHRGLRGGGGGAGCGGGQGR